MALSMLQGSISAFAPTLHHVVQPRASVHMSVADMDGYGPETGNKVFDPVGLAEMGGDKTLAFFRHAEIKHGRVAMAAMVGFLFHINHIHFDGYLSLHPPIQFETLSNMGPFDAWNAIPLLGQMQILWTIAGLEHASECLDPAGHYTKGGTPGNLKFLKNFWDTPGFTKKLSAEQLAEKRLSEIKNGRLAMIGVASICSAIAIPGSVPLLSNAPALTGVPFALPFGSF
jgi:hypothetical protein